MLSTQDWSNRPHRQLQNLPVGEVVHRWIIEMEAVGEALIVVGDECELEVAALATVTELLHRRGGTVVLLHLQHAVQPVRADREVVRWIVDELDRLHLFGIDLSLPKRLRGTLGARASEP